MEHRTDKDEIEINNYLLENVKEKGIVKIILDYEIEINDGIILKEYENKNIIFYDYLFNKNKELGIKFMNRHNLINYDFDIDYLYINDKDKILYDLNNIENYKKLLNHIKYKMFSDNDDFNTNIIIDFIILLSKEKIIKDDRRIYFLLVIDEINDNVFNTTNNFYILELLTYFYCNERMKELNICTNIIKKYCSPFIRKNIMSLLRHRKKNIKNYYFTRQFYLNN